MILNKKSVLVTLAALFANCASAETKLDFCTDDKLACESKCSEKGGHTMEVS